MCGVYCICFLGDVDSELDLVQIKELLRRRYLETKEEDPMLPLPVVDEEKIMQVIPLRI